MGILLYGEAQCQVWEQFDIEELQQHPVALMLKNTEVAAHIIYSTQLLYYYYYYYCYFFQPFDQGRALLFNDVLSKISLVQQHKPSVQCWNLDRKETG